MGIICVLNLKLAWMEIGAWFPFQIFIFTRAGRKKVCKRMMFGSKQTPILPGAA